MGRFLGREGAFFGMLVRGNIFMLLTLGIYRFWLTTDIRRYLWGNTEIAGDTFEYTGTAKELLIGFLLAIVLLLPLNALIYVGTLVPSILPYAGTVGFLGFALLGQFAFYRARRYRLTRTVYRGVRLFQTGSAVRYAIVASLWGIAILVTFGLLYPWAAANLERYKMRNTHFGNLSGSFTGSGTSLFFRGILIWLVTLAPVAFVVIGAIFAIDWTTLAALVEADDLEKAFENFGTRNPAMVAALGFFIGSLVWAAVVGGLLYPIFRAIAMRWWISGVQIGPIKATSSVRNGQVYWVYVRYILLTMAMGIAFSAFAGMFFGLFASFFGGAEAFTTKFSQSMSVQIIAYAAGVFGYAIFLLATSVLYQTAVAFRFWRLSFETTAFSGLEVLDSVIAAGEKSGVFGEGLADALDVGGF